MHCTAPAFANYGQDRALKQNFLYEFVGTCVLIGAIWGDKEGKIVGFPALVVVAIGLSLGSSTGYAINPARDLGPRIVWLFTEKLLSRCSVSRDEPSSSAQLKVGCDWSYAWVPVIAPVFAGVVMGCFKLININ